MAVSPTRALTAVHGRFGEGTPVDIRTRNGNHMNGIIGLGRYAAPDTEDIAVITLDDGQEFDHYLP